MMEAKEIQLLTKRYKAWRDDWNLFAYEALGAKLDSDQRAILTSVQYNHRTSVASGTARGKDYVAAIACLCFLYLTPYSKNGELIGNTKVAMTAPCYDDKTEILTKKGWKLFKDLTYDDQVAQLGEDHEIEFVKPLDIIIEPYIGEMIGCSNKMVDFLVTPNHRCLFGVPSVSSEEVEKIKSFHDMKCSQGPWSQYKTAKAFSTSQSVVNKCLMIANSKQGFGEKVRKAKDIYGKNGRFLKHSMWTGGKRNDPDWFEFLGFWFAEGSASYNEKSRKYRISLTQAKEEYIEYVDDLIFRNRSRFKNIFHKYRRMYGGFNWELYEKGIAKEFIQYGKQKVRYIPDFIKNADVKSLRAFIKGFKIGDGSTDKNGSEKLCTSSERMADDLHEICVKCGMIANKKGYLRRRVELIHSGQEFTRGEKTDEIESYFEIKLCNRKGIYPRAVTKDWYKKHYAGFVYCVKVPSGMVMVRRNGYNHWSGNTDRQVKNIMMPEISRAYNRMKARLGCFIPMNESVTKYGIYTGDAEWFLTGFKADEHNQEAWTGFHAVNTMFVITEASGISDTIFQAIEGNLQGNSRILIVFNPNRSVGYAAKSQFSSKWSRFRLNNLNAPNVINKNNDIPGQVDYRWVKDRIDDWCTPIPKEDVEEEEDDFVFEGQWYRPSDLFRVKGLGKFPKSPDGTLIPQQWIEAAQKRWKNIQKNFGCRIGVDVAGMGRDNTVYCRRFGDYVQSFKQFNSAGKAEHMKIAGEVNNMLRADQEAEAFIDTIGEGAGVLSKLIEDGYENRAHSCKFSESAKKLSDYTKQYSFANMKAYLYWAVRDWLDPKNGSQAMLPPGDEFAEECREILWFFRSDGKIIIEPKEDIVERLGRSTDFFDSLANTFYPKKKNKNLASYF